MNLRNLLAVAVLMICPAALALGQWREKPRTGSPQNLLEDRTNMSGMSGMLPQLKAGFIDKAKNAAEKKAVVHVEVWGVNLVPPGSVSEANNDQVYIAYVLDDNPEQKSGQTTHTFQNIPPGRHTITVQLMALNNQPIGAKMILGFDIPK